MPQLEDVTKFSNTEIIALIGGGGADPASPTYQQAIQELDRRFRERELMIAEAQLKIAEAQQKTAEAQGRYTAWLAAATFGLVFAAIVQAAAAVVQIYYPHIETEFVKGSVGALP